MNDAVILIPAYNPDEKLARLVGVLKSRFSRIVIVNDGSSSGADVFDAIRSDVTVVLDHPENRGKGAALKTGFAWIREHLSDARAVVTADADGQHTPADIEKVAEAALATPDTLTIGVRAFSGRVPFRSRFGNAWSRWAFFFLTGFWVHDTQTGLRGIPARLFRRMLCIPGERYEYEMRMLADAKHYDAPPVQVPIETVYLEENKSSHFHPVRDAIKTQSALLKFCFSSVLAFLVDNGVFTWVLLALRDRDTARAADVLVAIAAARFVSSNFNYFYNRFFVFRSGGASKGSYFQYWGLVLVIGGCSWIGTSGLARLFDIGEGVWITAVKIVVDTALFLLSYKLQKSWIFRKRAA